MFNIGTVPYCNALPLIHYLSETVSGVLSEWYPSTMRLQLQTQHLDMAMLPVAELMNLPNSKIISNCSIASNGDVRSVLLISRKPLEQIQTLSLDTASRSSVTIARLFLKHFYNLEPATYKLPLDKPLNDCPTDAFVVIGDRALAYKPTEQWTHRFDIGGIWKEKTGLPLVFAAWVACFNRERRTMDSYADWMDIAAGLQAARDKGTANIEAILDTERDFPAPRQEMFEYFTQNIVYTLGTEERKGLQAFFDLAVLHGFTKQRIVVEVIEYAN